jgi:hypothetical protein
LAVVLFASRFIEPSKLPEICMFKILTGIPCMFCGLTHAFHAISLGNLEMAENFHPLAFFALGLVIFLFVFSVLKFIFWEAFQSKVSIEGTLLKGAFVIFTVFWIYRLISGTLV